MLSPVRTRLFDFAHVQRMRVRMDVQYNDKPYHPPDLSAVLERAWAAGLEKLMITAGSLKEARAALELAKTDGVWIGTWLGMMEAVRAGCKLCGRGDGRKVEAGRSTSVVQAAAY